MRLKLSSILCLCACAVGYAQTAEWEVSATGNFSTGKFAPYFITSLTHGKISQKNGIMADAKVVRSINLDQQFSWGYGAECVMGDFSKNNYDKWDASTNKWYTQSCGPSNAWIQQCYAEVKYRGVFLTAGMKEHHAALQNQLLSSGDLVESGNSRPIPQVRIGFIDFQDIPFTRGWVQIQGEIGYGKFTDINNVKDRFNYYNGHITTGSWYNYKRCFFRTNPSQPFSVTVGMQAACIYGGHETVYSKGIVKEEKDFSSSLKTVLKVFLPMGDGGEGYYTGSHLGSWDFRARYRFANQDEAYAYFQGPWEDGSSIGRRNKMDGVWGLEYKWHRRGIINGVVIEYIDFRDQSGPLHWAPGDLPGTTITSEATGYDNYYNNSFYNAYANYGLGIGTPFLLAPLYNVNGNVNFSCTRANGMHAGAMGCLSQTLEYRVLLSYQRGLGTYNIPYRTPRTCTAAMVEACWNASALKPGLKVKCQAAYDGGSLRGNNFGALFTLSYSGAL